jgi:class 3 adenylate cyclase
MESNIGKKEIELISTAIDKILSQSVEEIEILDNVPPLTELTDSNKVFKGKLSILFVDIRKSTDLTDEIKSKKMVKIYRAFIRLVIQAIRYSGGYSRQFAGDGIMGVFQDSVEEDGKITSAKKAINAARYISTLVDYCLNPALKKNMNEVVISCGLGICTGPIMVTKAGMRGKETDELSEDELGIVWVGSTTNYASRFCSLTKGGEIFIDITTYDEGNVVEKCWDKTTRVKADKTFDGYITEDYYLDFSEDIGIEPIKSAEETTVQTNFIQTIFADTKREACSLIDDIAQKSAAIAMKSSELDIKEKDLKAKEIRLNQKSKEIELKEKGVVKKGYENKVDEYNRTKKIFTLPHCKKGLTLELGNEYWDEQLKLLIMLGSEIGKSEMLVKSEICYMLVYIYQTLGRDYEAYNSICIQAEYYPWIHAFTVGRIIAKVDNYSKLKRLIEARLKNKLDEELRNSLVDCLKHLK